MFWRRKNVVKQGSLVAVLDIGTSKFSCFIGERLDGPSSGQQSGEQPASKPLFKIIGFGVQKASGLKAGVLTDLEAAEKAVRQAVSSAEKMAGIEIEHLIVGVSCGRLHSLNFMSSIELAEQAIGTNHIDKVLKAGLDYAVADGRMLLHLIPLDYSLDEAMGIQEPIGMVGSRLGLDLHAITADIGPLKNIALLLDRCHLSIERMVATPYASALSVITDEEKNLGATVIDIGSGTTKMALYAGGHYVHTESIAIGGDLITYEIAQAFNMPLAEAERIKVLYGSVFAPMNQSKSKISYSMVGESGAGDGHISHSQLVDIIRPRVQQIFGAINERLDKSGFKPFSGQRLILTGGVSQMNGVVEFASEFFAKPVRSGQPPAVPGLTQETLNPSFSSPLGLFQALEGYDVQAGHFYPRSLASSGEGYMSRVGHWLKKAI